MKIEFMKEHPDSVPLIADWYFTEWKDIYDASGMSFEDVKRTVKERINTDRIPLAVVAIAAGQPVGTGCLKAHDMDTQPDLTPWLAGIYVEQSRRGQGCGSMIVKKLEEIAEELGIRTLYLYTPRSAKFYERLGWTTCEVTTYKGEDISIMKKILL